MNYSLLHNRLQWQHRTIDSISISDANIELAALSLYSDFFQANLEQKLGDAKGVRRKNIPTHCELINTNTISILINTYK